jgi:hypothetical protein
LRSACNRRRQRNSHPAKRRWSEDALAIDKDGYSRAQVIVTAVQVINYAYIVTVIPQILKLEIANGACCTRRSRWKKGIDLKHIVRARADAEKPI